MKHARKKVKEIVEQLRNSQRASKVSANPENATTDDATTQLL